MSSAGSVLQRAVEQGRAGPQAWRVLAMLGKAWSMGANVSANFALTRVFGHSPQATYEALGWIDDSDGSSGVGEVEAAMCCDVLTHGALGHPACPCSTIWENPISRRIAECADAPRQYPAVRSLWTVGADGTEPLGRALWCLGRNEVDGPVLDLFTSHGSGSALTLAHALQGKHELHTIEADSDRIAFAQHNLAGYSNLSLVHGRAQDVVSSLCKSIEFALVVLDPDPVRSDDEVDVLSALRGCNPSWWVLNNIQLASAIVPFAKGLLTSHAVVQHGWSPSADSRFGAHEFVVLRSRDHNTS